MRNEIGSRANLVRRLGVGLVSSAAGAILLSGCAAGQQAQTVQQTPSIDGVQADAGNIAIRAAGIAPPESGTSYAKGGTAQLRMVIINRSDQPDELVSASSTAASGAQLNGASAAGGSSASGTSPSASSGSASAGTAIALSGRQSVKIGIGSGGPTVALTGLSEQLFPAQPVPVTFTFRSGASVTVTLAVQLTSEAPPAPTISSATQAGGE